MIIEYQSNNSGGRWWLSDDDWKQLEANGWKVNWVKNYPDRSQDSDGRWLGALATSATKEFTSIEEAETEWESITDLDPHAAGCACCGQPHYFYEE